MDRENIFTVSEVNRHLRQVIENNIPNLNIEGEIANFTKHRSGHIYFSMKDNKSSIRCVFFRSFNYSLDFKPKDGDKVVCTGKLTVFEKSGNYQLNVFQMHPSGIGEMQRKFNLLKEKLMSEGLFSQDYKKSIPKYPESIGIVTSPTGAAIQDIKNVISRRFPCELILFPAVVQGENAANDVIAGIEFFNSTLKVDTIIIGRGGGSQEDLFCFNDEKLARTIFNSDIPIISAVGHEIDFTISDFVSDLRAPTPSAAAELAVPDKGELSSKLLSLANRMQNNVLNSINNKKLRIEILDKKLLTNHPQGKLQDIQQQVDYLHLHLKHQLDIFLQKTKHKLNTYEISLNELSPYEIFKRGYAIISSHKNILRSVDELQEDMEIEITLKDGNKKCKISDVR